MRTRPLLHTMMAIAATSLVFACADDEQTDTAADEVGDGDGDGETVGDGDGEPPGDGDGEPPGDGDGEPPGDGDPAGDGDGEPPGDGDGEPPGDGDGDGEPADACQMTADLLAPDLMHAEGGCTIVVRFNYETLAPLSWANHCGPDAETVISEEDARKLSDCCSDGERLGGGDDDAPLFAFYSTPDPDGGVSVISSQLGLRAFEGTITSGAAGGDIQDPVDWRDASLLGNNCGSAMPSGNGYDLTMGNTELEQEKLDAVLAAFADTALTRAIDQNGMIQRTLTLAYPRTIGPFDPMTAEYVVIVESGM